jgi:UTP-glucose-1-phosphate uridylyltransferase
MSQRQFPEFGRLLRGYREQEPKVARQELADTVGLSANYVYYLERGVRRPSRERLDKLADALSVTGEARDELFEAAGYNPVTKRHADPTIGLLAGCLDDSQIQDEQRAALAADIRRCIVEWRKRINISEKGVTKVVVPIAGWQARLLAPEKVQGILAHAFTEAAQANIQEVIVIIAPTMGASMFERLRDRYGLKMRTVVQDNELGLGHAVLLAQEHVGNAPFGLMLPDDVDPGGAVLGEMIERYLEGKRVLVAVSREPLSMKKPEAKYGGVAILGKPLNTAERVYFLAELTEKPADMEEVDLEGRSVVGRYILTPSIFGHLERAGLNPQTGRNELTDALALMSKEESVCAYVLDRDLLPCAPLKGLLEKLVESINNPQQFHEILRLTDETLEKIDKIVAGKT